MSDAHSFPASDRRSFLKTTAAAGALASAAIFRSGVFAGETNTLKIGLVGCGGRGTGAAADALQADPNVQLVAMGDAFADHITAKLGPLQKRFGSKVDVPAERQFAGFDAYKHVIDACDVVLLATPPHFRPMHLAYAVEKGKHVFYEKPVAVDVKGVRSVLQTAELAKKKGICFASGFCYRYDYGKRETIKRLHDGAIGQVLTIHATYNAGPIWHRGTNPKWSDMEYQVRNWYYFTWLSGDHIVEQHCHNHDKAAWVMNGMMPVAASGTGGRHWRTDPKYGNIFDHHAVVYEYANGTKLFSFCRQFSQKTDIEVSDHIQGTGGTCSLMDHMIKIGGKVAWKYEGSIPNMYQVEHNELFANIRAGKPFNDGQSAAYSSLMSIMGRIATYTGKRVEWDWLLRESKDDLTPPHYDMNGKLDTPAIAMPGVTRLV